MLELSIEKKINGLIDLHDQIEDAEIRFGLSEFRSDVMKYAVEETLVELGHSLKGIWGLSKRNRVNV